MKLSRSSGYAFSVLGYLARPEVRGPVLAKILADQFEIPRDYLFKVLQQLVRAGILDSVRGPHGGFCLARPSDKISMLDVVEAVEGPLSGGGDMPAAHRDQRYHQRLLEVYRQAGKQTAELLGRLTVAELLNEVD